MGELMIGYEGDDTNGYFLCIIPGEKPHFKNAVTRRFANGANTNICHSVSYNTIMIGIITPINEFLRGGEIGREDVTRNLQGICNAVLLAQIDAPINSYIENICAELDKPEIDLEYLNNCIANLRRGNNRWEL